MIHLVLSILLDTNSTATAPPEIFHARTTFVCTTVRKTLMDTIGNLRSNDDLLEKSDKLVVRMEKDTIANSGNMGAVGGASASLQMDQMQMARLMDTVTKQLQEADALLADPKHFPTKADTEREAQLLAARQDLENILLKQGRVRNTLYEMTLSGQSEDLNAQGDPIPEYARHKAAQAEYAIDPKAFVVFLKQSKAAEAAVEPVLDELVRYCSKG